MHFTFFDRHPRKPPLFQLRCECEDGCVAVIYAPLRRACQLLPRAAFSFHFFFFLAAFFLFFSKKQPASNHPVIQPPPHHIAAISLLLGHVRCLFAVVVWGRGRSLISTHGVHFGLVMEEEDEEEQEEEQLPRHSTHFMPSPKPSHSRFVPI